MAHDTNDGFGADSAVPDTKAQWPESASKRPMRPMNDDGDFEAGSEAPFFKADLVITCVLLGT